MTNVHPLQTAGDLDDAFDAHGGSNGNGNGNGAHAGGTDDGAAPPGGFRRRAVGQGQ